MIKIIGFTGPMGAGKSEAMEVLRDNYSAKLFKFASPLYEMQEFIYRRVSPAYTRPGSFTKDRKLLQWLGTEWGREVIGKNVWVDLWKADVARYISQVGPGAGGVVVCDDVRFDNEAEAITELGGFLVEIKSTRCKYRVNTSGSEHASEAGVKDLWIDYCIENNGTLNDLSNEVKGVYASILGDLSRQALIGKPHV